MELIVSQTDEDIKRHKLDETYIAFTCDSCGKRKQIQLKNINPESAKCARCDDRD